LRADIKAADAVLFVTPEYNRSIPGCLKNAVDVASRPAGKSMLDGRPAAVVSVTPYNLGAFGANHAIRQTFVFLNMPVMQQPEAYVARAGDLFDAKGKLTSDETRKFLRKFMAAFAQWIDRNGGSRTSQGFEDFMKQRAEAARAYVNGDAAPLDKIVARSGPASFFPPNGGSERGASAVLARYDRDAASFSAGGESELEVLQSAVSGDVAYWTGFQAARVKMGGGGSDPVPMKLRITELFRRIAGEWKMVHRHADSIAEPKKPDARAGKSSSEHREKRAASP
jgi:ketosteroid isomerase-like protein